jgi:predicted nucleic acid-binding protein
MKRDDRTLLDAGLFIGALMRDDDRHSEARPLVEAARSGDLPACTTTGILSEVYAALTWVQAQPRHSPEEAARAVRALVKSPSCIEVLTEGPSTAELMLDIVEQHRLTARRVHDARHAATALSAGVSQIFTYDVGDWKLFKEHGLMITGPPSVVSEEIEPDDNGSSSSGGGRSRLQ